MNYETTDTLRYISFVDGVPKDTLILIKNQKGIDTLKYEQDNFHRGTCDLEITHLTVHIHSYLDMTNQQNLRITL